MNYSIPLTVDVDITNRCNLSCTHCNKLSNTNMPELTLSQFVRLFNELYDLGIAEVSLGGGEPLLRRDWFDIVTLICSKPGWSVSVNTNGLFWRHTDIKKISMLEYSPRVAVSLDGYTPVTYSVLRRDICGEPAVNAFPKVVRTIQDMKEAGLNVCVNFVVTDRTANWLFDTIRLAETLEVDSFLVMKLMTNRHLIRNNAPNLSYQTWKRLIQAVTRKKRFEGGFFNRVLASIACPWELLLPLYEIGVKHDEIFRLWRYRSPLEFANLRTIHNLGCPAGVTYCCISADGMVTPCSAIPGDYQQGQCGCILEEGFEEVWERSPVMNMLRNLRLDDLQDSACRTCTLRNICGGGCRARGLFASGSICGPDTECPLNCQEE